MFIVVHIGTETTKYTAVGTCLVNQTEPRVLNERLLARLLLWGTIRA